jgi:2-polyprenyl-6-methoxyphenol hydroxylase-like FAD-dependent oxidoreductase
MSETTMIAIVGGSIAGLATALALRRSGRDVVVLERDPAPPDIRAIDAFDDWHRRGVPQFYHAHMLLARAQTIIRDDHPDLLEALGAHGVTCSGLDELQPWIDLGLPQPKPGDTDLDYVVSRRATFEYVLRQHVASLPHVRFIHGAQVTGLVTERLDQVTRVRGVRYKLGDAAYSLDADLVIDASGKRTPMHDWLREFGVEIKVERHPCEYVYLCRHYRLRDPDNGPPRVRTGGVLDYLGFGIFYGEAGHFSIGLAIPADEKELVRALKTEDGWDALCAKIPVLERWASAARVTSKVLGAGRFENRWVDYRPSARRRLVGLVAVGDSQVQTNPQFGRGMTMAFIQARLLAQGLSETRDLRALARNYYQRVHRVLRKHFDFCLASDRLFVMRARRIRGLPMTLGQRIFDYLYANGWHPAVHSSGVVATEMLRTMHMHEPPSFRRHIVMTLHIMRAWLLYSLGKIDAPPLVEGPSRDEMLAVARSYGVPTVRQRTAAWGVTSPECCVDSRSAAQSNALQLRDPTPRS